MQILIVNVLTNIANFTRTTSPFHAWHLLGGARFLPSLPRQPERLGTEQVLPLNISLISSSRSRNSCTHRKLPSRRADSSLLTFPCHRLWPKAAAKSGCTLPGCTLRALFHTSFGRSQPMLQLEAWTVVCPCSLFLFSKSIYLFVIIGISFNTEYDTKSQYFIPRVI